MQFSLVHLAALASAVAAQGVTEPISPQGEAPEGCSASYDGTFMVTVAKVEGASKRDVSTIEKRDECSGDGILVTTLSNGILMDAQSRTGYVASNYQFQFDKPAQAGAIYTAGFSACSNGSIALGSSTTFYACVSGTFSNLYDRSWAPQCSPVEMLMIPCGAGTPAAGQVPDGQIIGTQIITTTIVSAISDGQPQVITKTVPIPLCQITDGQLQAHTTPCASLPTAAPSTTPVALPPPVSQYSDGQIQVTAPAAVPTVSSVPPVVQTSDGQVQVTGTASAPEETQPATTPSAPAASENGTVPTVSEGTTLATTPVASTPASASTPATSLPVSSGAGAVQMGSMAAFVIGLVAAVYIL